MTEHHTTDHRFNAADREYENRGHAYRFGFSECVIHLPPSTGSGPGSTFKPEVCSSCGAVIDPLTFACRC